ncbi:Maf-like protein-domain-containing protein [Neohortaea acidophila]|uniref:Maf-like protein-domain-containing protein n=1 Tax=Neohortaea acidophila TaxID=245834 RepID=A0A6A6PTL5_9PEZI|nr:Maf-like protein-domain-containing protein [Neohortaea acidophila]KAF2483448.1 Maf-like protein-domain-containing protein [Neohortaea acidophila]
MDEKTPLEPPPSYDNASQVTPTKPAQAGSTAPPRPRPLDLPALNMIRGKRVILASASPRRRQLLAQIGLTDLEIVASTVPEDKSKSLAPFEYVLETAQQKALNVYEATIDSPKGEPALVIAADTVVSTELGQILEKPRSEKEHVAMLKMLRDEGWHKVYTAVVCMAPLESAMDPGYTMESHVEETSVKFDSNVTDELIVSYVRTREGVDKAGGYGIQGIGSILVESIKGTFDNVVGLPLRATLQLIEKVIVEPAVPDAVDDVGY